MFKILTALLLIAATASASRSLQQSANPPSPRFGGPNVTLDSSVQPPAGTSVRINWRGVGTQNFSSSSTSQYVPAGAVANLYLQNGTNVVGKHFFTNNAQGGTSPVFTRVDASGATIGIVVGSPTANQSTPAFNNDGGYGSIPTLLLQVTQAEGFFQGITWIQRINTLGGIVPGNPKLFTLPASPTGVANAQLAVPYQADYLFYQSASTPAGR